MPPDSGAERSRIRRRPTETKVIRKPFQTSAFCSPRWQRLRSVSWFVFSRFAFLRQSNPPKLRCG
jgi:hypothetical protein